MEENTNIENIIGLDNNQEALYITGKMISALGLNRITLEAMDGKNYDYKDTDIVYIAGFVPPKHKILDQIVKTSQKTS